MSRMKKDVAHSSAFSADAPSAANENNSGTPRPGGTTAWMGRAVFVVAALALSWAWQPFALSREAAAAAGFAAAAVLVFAELRFRRVPPSELAGAAAGLVLAAFTALLVSLVISRTAEPEPTKSYLEFASLLGFGYLGVFLGARRGFALDARSDVRRGSPSSQWTGSAPKLLDTSVLIDGRIADVCEAQFLDGPLQVPQFVLHELQQIADSSDTLRRQRGRRGLEVLQRIQKMPQMKVVVLEDEQVLEGEVDHRL